MTMKVEIQQDALGTFYEIENTGEQVETRDPYAAILVMLQGVYNELHDIKRMLAPPRFVIDGAGEMDVPTKAQVDEAMQRHRGVSMETVDNGDPVDES